MPTNKMVECEIVILIMECYSTDNTLNKYEIAI